MKAGIEGASAPRLVWRALRDSAIRGALDGRALTLIAAGKAAAPMAAAFLHESPGPVRQGVVASPTAGTELGTLTWVRAGHPVPDAGSVAAGRRVLELARGVPSSGRLVVLLSGGASAAVVVPSPGVTLTTKVAATRALLDGGVAIDAFNCVRKHLSAVKGGRLVAATRAPVVTLAISDVVGPVADDPTVIGSGPTAPDPTSFADALRVVDRPAVQRTFPADARRALERGLRGERPETPKPGDVRFDGCAFHVVGNRVDAMTAAARHAADLGYHVVTRAEAVVGDARTAGGGLVRDAATSTGTLPRPVCVVSSGETTVEVRGPGRGGRNQQLALAATEPVAELFTNAAMASVGTDGIDGPTDAAGAFVDTTTLTRARARGLESPAHYLDQNDAYAFFDSLDDLVRLGRTDTNVGDLQVLLIG